MNKANALETLCDIRAAAKAAGIYDHWFIAFGTLLGWLREGDFIAHDDDMDVGLLEGYSAEQEEQYVEELRNHGLFGVREVHSKRPDGRRTWFSLRRTAPPDGTKCCHWTWVEHGGFWWHSKGSLWVGQTKFNPKKYQYDTSAEALALGVPAGLLRHFVEVSIQGEMFRAPLLAGSLCDFWYSGWRVPRVGGASERRRVMEILKWSDRSTWRILEW